MKIDLKLPGGGEFHFEREAMKQERFEAICWLIGVCVVGSGVFKFLLAIVL